MSYLSPGMSKGDLWPRLKAKDERSRGDAGDLIFEAAKRYSVCIRVRCEAIAKTIMHPKALQVMSGVAVLIADGACNESNDLESIRKRCNHSSSKGEGGIAVVQAA